MNAGNLGNASNASSARRSRSLPFSSALVLAVVIGMAWGIAVWLKGDRIVAVEERIESHGAHLGFDYEFAQGVSMVRRGFYLIPGAKAFAVPDTLDAQGTEFGDDGLSLVSQIPEIRKLWLWDSHVSDDGLMRLPSLPSLIWLSVPRGTTEIGLECLDRLPALQRLQLSGCVISDKVIRRVIELRALVELDVRWADVTSEQLQLLQQQRPEIKITK